MLVGVHRFDRQADPFRYPIPSKNFSISRT